MADIKLDAALFQERLGQFYTSWKNDKRSGDAFFGGSGSLVVLMGKEEENAQYQKNNAMHVRCRVSICEPSNVNSSGY
jgi:nucleosome binding factor SPN SPT16 subunit